MRPMALPPPPPTPTTLMRAAAALVVGERDAARAVVLSDHETSYTPRNSRS